MRDGNATRDADDTPTALQARHHPRRATSTEHAIETAIDSAAHEVARALADDGVGPARVTPRDVLRSRHPYDTFDDEATTEPLPLLPRPPEPQTPRRALELSTPSLSPFSVDPRPAPRSPPSARPPRPEARLPSHAEQGARAVRPGPDGRRRGRLTFFSRAPSAPWILVLMTLGGFCAFVTTQVVRDPRRVQTAPSRAAAVAPSVMAPLTQLDASADAAAESISPRAR